MYFLCDAQAVNLQNYSISVALRRVVSNNWIWQIAASF